MDDVHKLIAEGSYVMELPKRRRLQKRFLTRCQRRSLDGLVDCHRRRFQVLIMKDVRPKCRFPLQSNETVQMK